MAPELPASSVISDASPGAAHPGAEKMQGRWIVPLIIAATLLAYSPLFRADFCKWDDEIVVAKNPRLNPPSWQGVLWCWKNPFYLYIPVTYTIWSGLAAIARVPPDNIGVTLNPWIFHGFNVLMHALAAVLAYRVLRLLVINPWAAFVGALVFSLHPLQVESVGWMAGLKDVLGGMFCLLSLWQYLLYAQADAREPGSGSKRGLVFATIAFILAMLSKPNAMTFPLIAAWLDFWLVRRPVRRIAPLISAWLVLSVGCAIVARIAQPYFMNPHIPVYLCPWLASDTIAFYLYKIVWPVNLCIQYDRAAITMLGRPIIFITWIVPFTLALLLWIFRKRASAYIAAGGVMVLGLASVLNLAPYAFQGHSMNADHYMYLPMFGVALAVAYALRSASSRVVIFVSIALIVVLGALTFRQSQTWRDNFTLFNHLLVLNPRTRVAHENLAATLIELRRYREAIAEATAALKIDPNSSNAYANRAAAYDYLGDSRTAERQYIAAIRLDPISAKPVANLASLVESQGQYDRAIKLYERALKLDPDHLPGVRESLESLRQRKRDASDAAIVPTPN